MGYLTDYTLNFSTADGFDEVDYDCVEFKFKKLCSYYESFWFEVDKASASEIKWYNYENDIRKITKEIPGLIIKIEGSGEESPDHWHGLAYDGKYLEKKAIISFPEIKLSELI